MLKKRGFGSRSAIFAGLLLASACASTGQEPVLEAVTAAPVPTEPAFVLDNIIDAEPSALDVLLGEQSFTRREGDGEFRRYSLSTCMLIIILYPDENGVQRAAFADAAPLDSEMEKPDLEACLAAGLGRIGAGCGVRSF